MPAGQQRSARDPESEVASRQQQVRPLQASASKALEVGQQCESRTPEPALSRGLFVRFDESDERSRVGGGGGQEQRVKKTSRDVLRLCAEQNFLAPRIFFGASLAGNDPPFNQTRVVPEFADRNVPTKCVDLEVKDRLIFLDAG